MPSTPSATRAKHGEDGDVILVHFIDVGHGDSALVQTPEGANILIDAGYTDMGQHVVNYLKAAGVKKLHLVIGTHPHSDHIGGMPAVFDAFDVDMVLDSGKTHTTRAYEDYLEAVKASPETTFKIARAGQKYQVGGATLSILSPRDPLPRNINDCSIVCRLSYGDVSVMFTGDAEEAAEKKILRSHNPLSSTVLKVGHHGSSTSTSSPFLRAVNPRVAVISCRERAVRGEYAPHAVHKLKMRGTQVYRTDLHGTVVFESDGKDYIIRTLGDQP